MRELRIGEDVLAPDGERLGKVERLVVDEEAHRVTHVIAGGRLVDIGKLRDAGPEGLAATLGRDEFQRLPEAHSELVGPAGEGWTPPPGYTLENFVRLAQALIGQGPYVPPVHADFDVREVHEITPSSPVWAGQERLGEVVRVMTDDAGQLVELVVDRGLRHGGRVRLPADRVVEVVGNNVHVNLTEEELDHLPQEHPS